MHVLFNNILLQKQACITLLTKSTCTLMMTLVQALFGIVLCACKKVGPQIVHNLVTALLSWSELCKRNGVGKYIVILLY